MKGLATLLFVAAPLCAADFRVENSTVLTSSGAYHRAQSRPAVIPPGKVIVTTQEIEKRGSHGYRDIYITETTDGAKTWSAPKRIAALNRKRFPDGIERVMGDICPQWHVKSGKLLVTGKCFGFLANPNDNKAKDDRSQERVAYAVYDPKSDVWSGMKIMAMPEKGHAGNPIIEPNAGCHQRHDLPDGAVLLPVRYRADPKTRVYTSVVTRCAFDGETLAYVEHGSEHTISIPRGLYEPSVCSFQGRYFLTMRGEQNGHVTRSDDGLNYQPTVEWKFDDGRAAAAVRERPAALDHARRQALPHLQPQRREQRPRFSQPRTDLHRRGRSREAAHHSCHRTYPDARNRSRSHRRLCACGCECE